MSAAAAASSARANASCATSSRPAARAGAGEAALFTSRQGAYANAPEVTRIRLYLEAIEKVLPEVRKFVIDSAIRLQTTDLWIPGANGAQTFPSQP